MTKAIAIALMALVVNNAALAEWIAVDHPENGVTLYADKSSIRKDGMTTTMLWLQDRKEPMRLSPRRSFLSLLVQTEFDCKKAKSRRRSISAYEKNMGGGLLMVSVNEQQLWESVNADTRFERLSRVACK